MKRDRNGNTWARGAGYAIVAGLIVGVLVLLSQADEQALILSTRDVWWTFEDPGHRYTFRYPAGWEVRSVRLPGGVSQTALIFTEDTLLFVHVRSHPEPIQGTPPLPFSRDLIPWLHRRIGALVVPSGGRYREIGPVRPYRLGGTLGLQSEFRVTRTVYGRPVVNRGRRITTILAPTLVSVEYLCRQEHWPRFEPVFERVLQSWQFLPVPSAQKGN